MTCQKPSRCDENDDSYPCLRDAGHTGDCTPALLYARRLDNKHLCCGNPKDQPHREVCRKWSTRE